MRGTVSDVINLNKKRKAKARADKEVRAAENRLKHGRPKHEKQAEKLKAAQLDRHLHGHKLDKKDD